MNSIRIGDKVTFRRDVIRKCGDSNAMSAFRAEVTEIEGQWLFMKEASGRIKVMPAHTMCKVQRNGLVLEVIR